MKSVMTHDFATTPKINAPRSKFDRSFGHKTTFDAGWLIPVYWDAVLPGDTFNLNMTAFARMATPLFPIMDNMYLDSHFFFVPNRLIWENFRKFCGEQTDPGDSIDYTIPILSGTGATSAGDSPLDTQAGRIGALMNYIGIPDGINPGDVDISALPMRSYALIYNEWFRDQNLIDSITEQTGDGPDTIVRTGFELQRRGKRHDYFTSALPWPQKGDAVSLPLGTTAPLQEAIAGAAQVLNGSTGAVHGTAETLNSNLAGTLLGGTSSTGLKLNTETKYEVDLTAATAATINDLREAFQVQKLLERDARAGTRYSELVANHFGVDFYDVSYRPEYLGGGSSRVNISPIAQQAENASSGTTTGTGVGQLGAMGTVSASGHGFTKSFVEHGIVMGIVSVRADLTYQKGLNRHLSHSTRYDYYWPSLAHLGEQAILNKEIYCDGSANDDDVFGYIPRYDEYRYKPSQITGLFQSDATSSLDPWHLSQDFGSLPVLGKSFIEEDGGSTSVYDRVIQVPAEPHFIFDSYFDLKCARPIPVNGVPGMIDHF